MQSPKRWVFVAVSSLLACAWGSSKALAYCQTTTSEEQVSSCSPTCVTDGYPLAWPNKEIVYVFNERGFPGLSDRELRGIFADAFGAWSSVDCEGEPVGLKVTAAKGSTALTVGPENQEPNASVISHLSPTDWAGLGLDARAFALTAIWFDANSGRILGADMHFNGGMSAFGVCPKEGCTADQRTTDLPNVATHEAGHFLGLAHSQDPGSTMWCDAQGNETNKRSLEPDDEKGICVVYPTGIAFTDDYFPTPSGASRDKDRGGCSISTVKPPAELATGALARGELVTGLMSLAAVALVLRRRRR